LLGSTPLSNQRTEDTTGGVQSLIDNGKSSQAKENESVPTEDNYEHEDDNLKGFWTSPNAKPLFNSLVGFALEIGDRLLINDEEVVFKGWVDQSQTAIEVKAIANDLSQIKQIRAKEIKSLARSQDVTATSPSSVPKEAENFQEPRIVADTAPPESVDETNDFEVPLEAPELIPEYNAWEVWTYLERQRLKTLKLLNTFRAEWEANRFIREAERSTPSNLRVHYEIRPILLDETEINEPYQTKESAHKSDTSQLDDEDYADAIDVEIIV